MADVAEKFVVLDNVQADRGEAHVPSLTARQTELLDRLIDGIGPTNKELGLQMGITEHTIKVLFKGIITVLKPYGVKNRVGCAIWRIRSKP